MLEKFDQFRPKPLYPTYPPYHQGLYLEDYFCDWFHRNNIETERKFIPVSWTTCYIDKKTSGLQEALDSLNPNDKYFVVSQFDDGILENLPPDTIHFSAGGNKGGVPIPLVCSSMYHPLLVCPNKVPLKNKNLLCSFVGSVTHPIRSKVYESMKDSPNCSFHLKDWNPEVSNQDQSTFVNISTRSKFVLCPRGYGLNSFRLYECFQLGSVPVIITDKFFLPWSDELDWNEFAVLIHEDMIPEIYDVLSTIDDEQYQCMLNNGMKLYKDYFTLNGTCKNIIKRIK